MPHHTFGTGSRALPIPDERLALLKFFLMLGARQAGNKALFAALSQWRRTGPGEWSNMDERPLVDGADAFEAAQAVVDRMGGVVSRQYIRDNVPELDPSGDWDTKQVLDDLAKLRRHVRPRSNWSGAFWGCIVHAVAIVAFIPIAASSMAMLLLWIWPLWWIANIVLRFTHTAPRKVVFIALSALWLIAVPYTLTALMMALGARM